MLTKHFQSYSPSVTHSDSTSSFPFRPWFHVPSPAAPLLPLLLQATASEQKQAELNCSVFEFRRIKKLFEQFADEIIGGRWVEWWNQDEEVWERRDEVWPVIRSWWGHTKNGAGVVGVSVEAISCEPILGDLGHSQPDPLPKYSPVYGKPV